MIQHNKSDQVDRPLSILNFFY